MDMREMFTIDGRRFSNMAGFYDEVEQEPAHWRSTCWPGQALTDTCPHREGTPFVLPEKLSSAPV